MPVPDEDRVSTHVGPAGSALTCFADSMAQSVHVWPESPRDAREAREINAELEWPGRGRTSIWFRLPSQHLNAVTASADPFLLAVLFPAMRHGHPVHVHGQV